MNLHPKTRPCLYHRLHSCRKSQPCQMSRALLSNGIAVVISRDVRMNFFSFLFSFSPFPFSLVVSVVREGHVCRWQGVYKRWKNLMTRRPYRVEYKMCASIRREKGVKLNNFWPGLW